MKPKINFNSQPTEQDINILFGIINEMSASDALKAVERIKDNIMLLSKLANESKYTKVSIKAQKKLLTLNPS